MSIVLAEKDKLEYINSRLADEIMDDQLSLSSDSEKEIDFWINYQKQYDDRMLIKLEKYYIDDEVKHKIRRLKKINFDSSKNKELDFRY